MVRLRMCQGCRGCMTLRLVGRGREAWVMFYCPACDRIRYRPNDIDPVRASLTDPPAVSDPDQGDPVRGRE